MNFLLLMEAASSIAIEHPSFCECVVCRAVHGDTDALAELMVAAADLEDDVKRLAQRRDSAGP